MSGTDPVPNPAAPLSRNLPLALKDATLAGLVAFGLFFFMIGLRTDQGPTGALQISTRFQTFAIIVAAVFAGVFLRTLAFGRGPIPLSLPPGLTDLADTAGRFAAPGAPDLRAAGAGAVLQQPLPA